MNPKQIRKIISEVEGLYPYKQIGNPDSYSSYNEGWCDALDILEQRLIEKTAYGRWMKKWGYTEEPSYLRHGDVIYMVVDYGDELIEIRGINDTWYIPYQAYNVATEEEYNKFENESYD